MEINKQAVVHPTAELGKNVTVGPFTVIGENVMIGDGVEVGPSALIENGTRVGKNCRIFHGASLGGDPQILQWHNVPSTVVIGEGTVVREFVTVHRSGEENGVTRVGRDCMLMAYSHVAHDCEIGDNVVIVNGTGLSGHILVEDFAFISGMVGIHQHVRIGTHCMIGGSTAIRRDVLPYSLVEGPPPRLVGINSVGLKRRGFKPGTRTALKSAFKIIRQSDLNTSQALEQIEAEIEMLDEIRYLLDFINGSSRGITK